MPQVRHFYRLIKPDFEYCFNVETSAPLTTGDLRILRWLLAETFELQHFGQKSFLKPLRNVIEVGPRMDFETAYSTNAVAICHACGIEKVTPSHVKEKALIQPCLDKSSVASTYREDPNVGGERHVYCLLACSASMRRVMYSVCFR